MLKTVGRGVAAGAAGVTALNGVTYLDMALRGRPESSAPAELVGTVLDRVGIKRPDDKRLSALGALAGIKVGLLAGVGCAVARKLGVRLPTTLAVGLTGAAAMAASDVPLAVLGVSDPREWSPVDWAADALPHLAYGAAVHGALVAFERHDAPGTVSRSLTAQAFSLGWACGGRTSFGPAALALTASRTGSRWSRLRTLGALGASGGEVVVDKLPNTPSRLRPEVLAGRIVAGAGSAGALARRQQQPMLVPAALGAAGAVAGSFAGNLFRRFAATKAPDWRAAVAEDIVTAGIAAWGAQPRPTVAAGL
jgi:uncharacterized membrane protein